MQTKLILTTAVLLGLAAPAHAQLFTPGGTFNFNIGNSPGTSNNVVTFTPGNAVDRWRRCRLDAHDCERA